LERQFFDGMAAVPTIIRGNAATHCCSMGQVLLPLQPHATSTKKHGAWQSANSTNLHIIQIHFSLMKR